MRASDSVPRAWVSAGIVSKLWFIPKEELSM
ncbi:MAG: hypothetical protein ACI89L_000892, partial [Phycisphaerales bacterium]